MQKVVWLTPPGPGDKVDAMLILRHPPSFTPNTDE